MEIVLPPNGWWVSSNLASPAVISIGNSADETIRLELSIRIKRPKKAKKK